eukprot:PhM_4_TR18299/c0_g1_i1/m.21127
MGANRRIFYAFVLGLTVIFFLRVLIAIPEEEQVEPKPNNYNNNNKPQNVFFKQTATPLSSLKAYREEAARLEATRTHCRYVFDRYEPSPWEARWAANISYYERNICKSMRGEFKPLVEAYVSELPKCTINSVALDTRPKPTSCQAPNEPTQFDERVFSKMFYTLQCPDGITSPEGFAASVATFIEPLVGVLRHPRVCETENYRIGARESPFIFDKNYMVLDEWTVKRNVPFFTSSSYSTTNKNFYFDAGASVWDDGAGGTSQSWMVHMFDHMCMRFDGGMFLWEAQQFVAEHALSKVPGHLKPYYHWFNEKCSPDEASWDNPLNHILERTRPDDFVALKIDIDTSTVELPLLRTILNTPELLERIDELYFEHHITMEILEKYWTMAARNRMKPVLSKERQSASLKLFGDLRRRGVRAHSWV